MGLTNNQSKKWSSIIPRWVAQLISMLILFFLLICAYIKNYTLYILMNIWRVDKWILGIFAFSFSLVKRILFGVDDEKHIKDVRYYAERYGFMFEQHELITEDGFLLKMHRIYRKASRENFIPVLVQHGLFQSSGIFVTNEEDSMAFILAEQGYDVWLGNNRGIYEGHISKGSNDPDYWDWSLDELAQFDFPCMINYVSNYTGHSQITYIGHSQGNAQAFMGLSHNPELSKKLKLFVAIAPAFHIKTPRHWALQALVTCPKNMFQFFFGTKSFIPIMCKLQSFLPPFLFSHMAYNMFAYLFNWDDMFWDKSRKPKYFLFTPTPLPVKLILHWSDIIKVGRIHPYKDNVEGVEHSFCSLANLRCSLALFYSTNDSLVHADRLIEECISNNVPLFHVEKFNEYEHMDLIWAKDAKNTVFSKLVEVIDRAQLSTQEK